MTSVRTNIDILHDNPALGRRRIASDSGELPSIGNRSQRGRRSTPNCIHGARKPRCANDSPSFDWPLGIPIVHDAMGTQTTKPLLVRITGCRYDGKPHSHSQLDNKSPRGPAASIHDKRVPAMK